MRHLAFLGASTLSLTGCALFTPAANNDTVYRDLNLQTTASDGTVQMKSVILDAYQRAIISKTKIEYVPSGNPTVTLDPKIMVNCAEASPDVFAATAIALSANASLSKATGTKVDANSAIAAAITQSAAQAQHSQAIQLLRDKMFATCLAYANGAITPEQYHRQLSSTGEASVVLVMLEGLLPPPVAASPTAQATEALPGSSSQQQSPPASPPPSGAASPSPAESSATGGKGKGKTALANETSAAYPGVAHPIRVAYDPSLQSTRPLLRSTADVQYGARVASDVASAPVAGASPSAPASPGPANAKKKQSVTTAAPPPPKNGTANAAPAPSTPPPQPTGPSTATVTVVQNIVSQYLNQSLAHDCIDYYTAKQWASIDPSQKTYTVQHDQKDNSVVTTQVDPEAGLSVYCQQILAQAMTTPKSIDGTTAASIPALSPSPVAANPPASPPPPAPPPTHGRPIVAAPGPAPSPTASGTQAGGVGGGAPVSPSPPITAPPKAPPPAPAPPATIVTPAAPTTQGGQQLLFPQQPPPSPSPPAPDAQPAPAPAPPPG